MMFSRQTNILFALLLLLVSLVAYRSYTREEPRRVKELTFKPGAGKGLKPTEKEGSRAKADAGKEEKRAYRGVIRNPFQQLFPQPPPPILKKPVPPPPPAPVPTPFPVITAKGPSPAQIESGKIKFLGFLQKEGGRKIFLLKDKEIFIVKKGDSIGILQVGDITENSVTLITRDTKEEFKLTIEEVRPTRPVPGTRR